MGNRSDDIDRLSRKLNILISKQDLLNQEIEAIRQALNEIRTTQDQPDVQQESSENIVRDSSGIRSESMDTATADSEKVQGESQRAALHAGTGSDKHEKPATASIGASQGSLPLTGKKSISHIIPESVRTNLEDFIGTNLINKVGILVLIIGIGIGTKFAIDRNLISPMVRLILGYILGSALLFFAYRLKKNYHNFSAVLCSGSMAVMYFMTYAGIAYFSIFSMTTAFIIMVTVTVFTVYQALAYDRQVIAIIGLVGAYAIPFLIGDDPDAYVFLFSYIAIINLGILYIALKKYWKFLLYTSFAATWIIFAFWWLDADGNDRIQLQHTILFISIYFLIFYASFLVNKVLNNLKFSFEDVILISGNAFIFYGIGYGSFSAELWKENLGLFTLINATIHLLVVALAYYRKEKDETLLKLIFLLFLLFMTIFIPVQFDRNWVTLFWILEGTLLFIYSRKQQSLFFEILAYPVIVLALYSLMDDWRYAYETYGSLNSEHPYQLFQNLNFGVSCMVIICLSLVNYIDHHPEYASTKLSDPTLQDIARYMLIGGLIFVTYYTFRFEMAMYFRQMYAGSGTVINAGEALEQSVLNEDILYFKSIWIYIYTMIYFSFLTILNIVKLRHENFGYFSLLALGTVLFIFLLHGLYILSELRVSYLEPVNPDLFNPGKGNLVIRYLAFTVFFLSVYVGYRQFSQPYSRKDIRIYLDLFTSIAVLWILSSELLQWLDLGGSKSSYKLGLSILGGTYSLILIVIGIWRKKKYLRITAISLFAITLIKLVAYDMSGMDNLSKTIVFILLGGLLLIISFLYNKYRKIIF